MGLASAPTSGLFFRDTILLLRNCYEMVWLTGWWRKNTIQSRKAGTWSSLLRQANKSWSLNGGSGIAYQHLRPIKHKRLRPDGTSSYTRPQTYSRTCNSHPARRRTWDNLGELARDVKIVAVPLTGSVTGSGNCDTLVLRIIHANGLSELTDDPSVSEPIVQHHWVARGIEPDRRGQSQPKPKRWESGQEGIYL